MKRSRERGVVKGASSGVLISVLLHAAAFALAGILVVVSVVQKEERVFEAPKAIERPKMKLKKPRVKVRKNARPKSASRIVTKIDRASMPDIRLPAMSGMGQGFGGGGLDGFELAPNLEELTLMGVGKSIGSDLEGTFYDLNRSRNGGATGIDLTSWREEFRRFLLSGWRPSTLGKYYRSPRKLYATSMVFPPALSTVAPAAFGDRDAAGAYWMVHYKGMISYPEKITFRFWLNCDENLVVKIDDEVVVANTWRKPETNEVNTDPNPIAGIWETNDMMMSHRFYMGNNKAVVGDWITLEPGKAARMEMVLGDNGGQACFMLAVEVKGVEYPKTSQGGPLLPAFKTSEFSRDMLDLIYKNLVEDEISLTTGPVFNDYGSRSQVDEVASAAEAAPAPAAAEAAPEEEKAPEPRSWTLADGRVFEARFVCVVGANAVMEAPSGRQSKVALDQFSPADRRRIELSRPPKFDVELVKDIKQKTFAMQHVSTSTSIRPPEKRARFGARVRQTSAGEYPHELRVEYFAVGQERLGQKYILLDRHEASFTPTRGNDRSFEFKGEREVILENYLVDNEPRGETYATYLVTVTDERGEIVAVSAPSAWLYENLEKLRRLAPGNYMNKQCDRVFPTRPPKTRY